MTKTTLLGTCAASVFALAIAMPASAQDVGTETTTPDIIVTGSLIRGTPEDAALPVDVIGSDELAKQGSPSAVELIKNLPVSNGVIGDANQFDSRSQGNEGVASVNLRGLGPQRSLVLLNGRRIVPSGGSAIPIVDINLIPSAAIGRIEVLKDGAAATYGSDAIGGVVNFITRENQQGFLVAGDYRYIKGSKGDYGGSISYGHSGNGLRVFGSFGYQRRSELQTVDRDFAVLDYPTNPQGGWTGGGNPGNFDFNATVGGLAFTTDLGCTAVGGFRTPTGSATDRCFNNYGQFGNLVEPEERLQAFLDVEIDLTDNARLRMNALYGWSKSQITGSPSYLPTLPPSANAVSGGGGIFQIPTYAPALRDYCRVYGAAAGCVTAADGTPLAPALAFPVLFRSTMLAGNPVQLGQGYSRGSSRSPRTSDFMHFSADLDIDVTSDINLTTSFTFSQYYREFWGADSFGDLFQNALAGFGGPNCAYASSASRAGLTATQIAALAGTNGCTYWNPFSTAIQSNPVTGQTNPNYAGSRATNGLSTAGGAGLVNDVATFDNFFRETQTVADTQQFVGDVVLSGSSGIDLPGGSVGFAIGAQYRKTYYERRYNADSNLAVNPCPGTPLNPAATCNPQTGALGFLGTNLNGFSQGDVYALFAELQVPITERINLQLAARYEDYGGAVGSTFDPQARVRFQLTDWLAIRGGVGTTFRGPPAQQLGGNITALQIIGTSFRAVDINGNPNLRPESATTYNAGILVNSGGFTASLDYFRYDFDGAIESEPIAGMVNALFGATGAANCGNSAYAALQARFTFTAAGCNIANVTRLRTQVVNSADIRTSGIDAQAQYRFDFGGGDLTIGASGTYVIEYKTADTTVEGIIVQPAFDGVGLLNYQTTAYPLPQWKGAAYLEGNFGIHSARLQYNYIDGYTDQRGAAIFGPNAASLAGASSPLGKEIDSFGTLDFTYRMALNWGTTISLSALNILDTDPPFARLDQNYDPFTASPLGFTAKIGVSQRF